MRTSSYKKVLLNPPKVLTIMTMGHEIIYLVVLTNISDAQMLSCSSYLFAHVTRLQFFFRPR